MLAILRPCWNNGPVAADEPRIERVEKGVGSLFNRHVPDVCEPVAFPIKPAPLAVSVREVHEVGSVVSLSRSGRKCCQRKRNGHDCPPHVSSTPASEMGKLAIPTTRLVQGSLRHTPTQKGALVDLQPR